MKIIGLTGMSGSGKSYVSGIFSSYGVPCINSDAVVHELYSGKNPCTLRIVELFGPNTADEDFRINRKALASVVFSDRRKLKLLNETVHPFVVGRCMEIAEEYRQEGTGLIVIEAPQLFESGLDKDCDYIVCVCSDAGLKKERIMSRDGISVIDAERRLLNQHDDEFFKAHSDFVIMNDVGSDVDGQVRQILRSILGSDDLRTRA